MTYSKEKIAEVASAILDDSDLMNALGEAVHKYRMAPQLGLTESELSFSMAAQVIVALGGRFPETKSTS